jgi:hypothetical protein
VLESSIEKLTDTVTLGRKCPNCSEGSGEDDKVNQLRSHIEERAGDIDLIPEEASSLVAGG